MQPCQETGKINEIIFLIEKTDDDYTAKALGYSIFTEADSLEELGNMIRDAVERHFDDKMRPKIIGLHIAEQGDFTL